MTVETLPDVEGACRTHMRLNAGIAAAVGEKVLFGVVGDDAQITVRRVGGGDDTSEAPIHQALIQFDCWGAPRNKAQAWAVASAVLSWARAIRRATALTTEVTAYGVDVESVIWAPDDADRPRYSITASVMARSNPA